MTIHGVDTWSAYRVDWHALRAAGFRFAYIRCTEATAGTDAGYPESVAGAREASIAHGAYCVLHVDQDAEAQIAHFLRHARDVGMRAGELPPALDLEVPWNWAHIGIRVVLARILRAVELLTDHYGRSPTIYTSSGWWRDLHAVATPEELATLAACPLWAAGYLWAPHTLPSEDAPGPHFGPWSRATWWQFSGEHSAPIPAIVSAPCPTHTDCQRVDRDVFLGTSDELDALALVPVTVPAPPIAPVPLDVAEVVVEGQRERDEGSV